MEKTLFDTEKQPWSKIRESYFELLSLAQENSWLSAVPEDDSFWNKIKMICDFLDRANESKDISYQEQHALSSLGREDMAEFIEKINFLKNGLTINSNSRSTFDSFILMADSSLQDQNKNNRPFFQALERVKILEVQLESQFEIILYILGQKSFVTPYSVDEFIEFFSDNNRADIGRFVITLIEAKFDEKNIRPFIEFIFESILGDPETLEVQDTEDWFNWLVIYYALDLVWFHFFRLSSLQRDYLLKNYFYRSIVVGLPIEKFISFYISDSLDVIEFLNKHKTIIDSLDANEESVLTNLQNNSFELFTDLWKKYVALNKDTYSDGYRMNDFLNNIYGSYVGREPFINWLRKAFALYLSIREAVLVDWDEIVFDDQKIIDYEREMVKAVSYFEVNGDFLGEIVASLKDEKFSLSALLREISKIVDLNNEKDIERITNLDSILKQSDLLPQDKDLISFDEQKGEFVWNEDLKI